ncbi:putative membrane protein [Hartmannibacter diazotrophicus]|uniref:Putative membrane protein n=1 Tax=Hartmannibacter diazotrophicus TaxID=1482074 RepID=A0A2C9D0G4_9HYPH|nr:DUF1345 domain-containing protein [Hartmannibacter diazotrophicus]SON53812.1 putative membrane protein [Hartmannibacter diazotrophicus]
MIPSYRLHKRLYASAVVGLVVAAFWSVFGDRLVGPLIGWNCAVLSYLALIGFRFAETDVDGIRRRAAIEDEGAMALLGLSIAAALASLGAIVMLLVGGKTGDSALKGVDMALAVATIFLSWAFVQAIFAIHYAHEYYAPAPNGEIAGGLEFPGGQNPDYLDFLYFSAVIGATAQTADVGMSSRRFRRLGLAHGTLAFVFNTTILALLVNIGASLL